MIIGKGLIAAAFAQTDHSKLLVFASGVSDSRSTDAQAYQREHDLLLQSMSAHPQLLLVYFSTYSIDDPLAKGLAYVQHKLAMETLIRKQQPHYLLVRTGNISGETGNPATLTNFFHHKIVSGEHFDCWKNAGRNLLDISHLVQMVHQLVKENRENETVYLVNPVSHTAGEIVEAFEKTLGKKAHCTLLEKGSIFPVDTVESDRLFKKLNISNEAYMEKLISKYYGHGG